MRIRFDKPVSGEVASDDGMRVHYAPAKRPRLKHGGWYLLLAVLSLALVVIAVAEAGAMLCR